MDIAALRYFKQKQEESGLTRPEFAKKAGIPFQTIRKWWDSPKPISIKVGDIELLAKASGVTGLQAYKEIRQIAATIEEEGD